MIEYKQELDGPNFVKADEQYILCVANCINTKLDKTREPLVTTLFTKYPEANIYKERAVGFKDKPGTLIIKGKIAIILGTMYPGTKEYANDNREFRLKWFREGLIQLQKMSPRSLAIRENFSEEFGGDWNKYLYHLSEMDKSIKISIYPYVIAIPIFNIVKFRQEDQIDPSTIRPQKVTKIKTLPVTGKFGAICLDKFEGSLGDEDIVDQKVGSGSSSGGSGIKALPTATIMKLPPILGKPRAILPIKITEVDDGEIVEEVKKTEVKSYLANPDWIDISNFKISGWDEIINEASINQKLVQINNLFFTKELPKFGDFFKIYPPQYDMFNAFNMCPFSRVRVVIVGMDPYINTGEAMGLAFSVGTGIKIPPSLKNIFKELTTDIPGFVEPKHGNLEHWANQGVFLINSALTVREGQSGSHLDIWQPFTDEIISLLSQNKKNLVFILWGNPAKKKQNVIKNISNHFIVTAAHPSPLSASKGFFGSKCFSITNQYLRENGLVEIDWQIPNMT